MRRPAPWLGLSIPKLLEFPLLKITLDGVDYGYQYQGQKDHTSELPQDSYTKVIEGNDKDLRQAELIKGKQIIRLYSCSNECHWKKSIRKLLPNPNEKIVFGTSVDSSGLSAVDALFIFLLANHTEKSDLLTTELDKIPHACATSPCFTVY